ncbi:MAG: hypothetical protein WC683_05065 [bacterium]
MKAATKKAIDAVLEELEEDDIQTLTKHASAAHLAGDLDATQALRLEIDIDQASKEALAYAREYRVELTKQGGTTINGTFTPWLSDRNEETRNQIAALIEKGLRDGTPTGVKESGKSTYPKDSIAQQLHDFFGARKSHATTVARSEIARIQNQGSLNRYEESEVEEVDVLDGDGCEACVKANGQRWTVAYAREHEIEHPNCVLPETRCETAEDLVSGFRALYDGPTVELVCANAGRVTVSPNHMILTPHGFAAANLLRKGDHVFYCPDLKRVVPDDPDHDEMPPTIEEIFGTLLVACGGSARRVPLAPEDLHGDAIFTQGDIDIIRADRLLWDPFIPSIGQHLSTDPLDPCDTDPLNLPRLSSLAQLFHRAARALDSRVGGLRTSSPFFRSRMGVDEQGNFSPIPQNDPRSRKTPLDGTAVGTEPVLQIEDSLPRLIEGDEDGRIEDMALISNLDARGGEKVADRGGSTPVLPRQIQEGLSTVVQVDEILEVNVSTYHGYVYDLQTLSTLTVCNSYLCSNCERAFIPVVKEA